MSHTIRLRGFWEIGRGGRTRHPFAKLRQAAFADLDRAHLARLLSTLPAATAGSSERRSDREQPQCPGPFAADITIRLLGTEHRSFTVPRREYPGGCHGDPPARVDSSPATILRLLRESFSSPEGNRPSILESGTPRQNRELDFRRDQPSTRIDSRSGVGSRARRSIATRPIEPWSGMPRTNGWVKVVLPAGDRTPMAVCLQCQLAIPDGASACGQCGTPFVNMSESGIHVPLPQPMTEPIAAPNKPPPDSRPLVGQLRSDSAPEIAAPEASPARSRRSARAIDPPRPARGCVPDARRDPARRNRPGSTRPSRTSDERCRLASLVANRSRHPPGR